MYNQSSNSVSERLIIIGLCNINNSGSSKAAVLNFNSTKRRGRKRLRKFQFPSLSCVPVIVLGFAIFKLL